MVLTAFLVGMTLLTTVVLISEMQTSPVYTLDEGYHLHMASNQIETTGTHVGDVRTLERALASKPGYRANFSYWQDNYPETVNISFQGSNAELTALKDIEGINARFTISEELPDPGETITLEDVTKVPESQEYDYENEWYVNGDLLDTNEQTTNWNPNYKGVYTVALEATTESGDYQDTEERSVRIGTYRANYSSVHSPITRGEILEVEVESENLKHETEFVGIEFLVIDSQTNEIVGDDSEIIRLGPWESDRIVFNWDSSNVEPDDGGTEPGDGRYYIKIRDAASDNLEEERNIVVLP